MMFAVLSFLLQSYIQICIHPIKTDGQNQEKTVQNVY